MKRDRSSSINEANAAGPQEVGMKRIIGAGIVMLMMAVGAFMLTESEPKAGHSKVQGWVITRTAMGNLFAPIFVEPDELAAPSEKFTCKETKRQFAAASQAHKLIIGGSAESYRGPLMRRDGGGSGGGGGGGTVGGGGCLLGDPNCSTCWTPIYLFPGDSVPIDCRNACVSCWAAN